MKLFDHFALLAPFYDRIFATVSRDRLLELLDLRADGRLLDVGGGTGRVSTALANTTGEVVVTDLSVAMLRQARSKGGLHAVCAHAERLPFPNGSFDRALVVDAFHHLCDQEQAASELLRVLTPGGRLVVEEPNIEHWLVKLVAMGERLALMRSRFHGPEDMRHIFETQGGRVTMHTDDAINAWVVVDKPYDL